MIMVILRYCNVFIALHVCILLNVAKVINAMNQVQYTGDKNFIGVFGNTTGNYNLSNFKWKRRLVFKETVVLCQ